MQFDKKQFKQKSLINELLKPTDRAGKYQQHYQLKGLNEEQRNKRHASLFVLGHLGVCLSLCAHYLVKRLKDKDFWSWLQNFDHKFAVVSLYLNDDWKSLQPAQMQGNFTRFLEARGLRVKANETLNLRAGVGWEDMPASLATKHKDCPGVVCKLYLRTQEDTAHAIAVVRQGGRIYLMDPEFGEAAFENAASLTAAISARESSWRIAHDRWDQADLYYYDFGASVSTGPPPPRDLPPPPRFGPPPPGDAPPPPPIRH